MGQINLKRGLSLEEFKNATFLFSVIVILRRTTEAIQFQLNFKSRVFTPLIHFPLNRDLIYYYIIKTLQFLVIPPFHSL